jgi:hypothetical protein
MTTTTVMAVMTMTMLAAQAAVLQVVYLLAIAIHKGGMGATLGNVTPPSASGLN